MIGATVTALVAGGVGLAGAPAANAAVPSYAVTATVQLGFAGGDVAIDPSTHTAYVVNTNADTVTAVDTITNMVEATIPVGQQPFAVAVDPGTHRAYVSNTGFISWPGPVSTDRTLSVIDTTTNTVVSTIQVYPGPRGVAVDPGTHAVYVATYIDNQMAVRVDPTTTPATVTRSDILESRPWAAAVDPSTHRAYISTLFGGAVSVVDGTTILKTIYGFNGPTRVAIEPATSTTPGHAYVANGGRISVIDTSTETLTAVTLPAGNGVASIAVDPATDRGYITNSSDNTVSVVNLTTNTIVETVPVGSGPSGVAIDPSTHRVYVLNSDGTMSVISLPAQTIGFTSVAPTTAAIGGAYTATATGGASGNDVTFSTASAACTVSTDGHVAFVHAGDCVVAADQAGNDQYAPAAQQLQTISVAKTPQAVTITSTPPSGPVVGDSYIAVASGSPSGNAVVLSSATPGTCTVADNTVSFLHAGTCGVLADQVPSSDYSAAPEAMQQIVVGRAPQAITFTTTPPSTGGVGGGYNVAALGGASGKQVRFSTASSACAISGSTVLFLHAGSCAVDADQSGSSDYTAAPQVHQVITVAPIAQTVTITSTPPATPVVGMSYPVNATGGASGEPVDVAVSTTNGACTLAGSTVDFVHPGSCVVSVSQDGVGDYAAATTATQTIAVSAAATTTTLGVTGSALTATVTVTAPGDGVPTGSVDFSIDGTSVGSAPVIGGTATLTHTVSTGASRHVAAVYSGDPDFTGSSVSASRNDPSITATVTSARAKTRYGWYRTPVTVTFHCVTHGAELTAPCPDAVVLNTDGAGLSVTRTIAAADGGMATVAVRGLNLDRGRPTVSVAGVRNGAVYNGTAPTGTCAGSDALSGIASCTVSKAVSGSSTTLTATATDRAGNVSTTHVRYTILGIYIEGVTQTHGAFSVEAGRTVTIVVSGSARRPSYIDAAVSPKRPSGVDHAFHAAGTRRWTLGVTITKDMRSHTYWNVGVKIASVLHVLTIRVS